jgi:hypothetical protein
MLDGLPNLPACQLFEIQLRRGHRIAVRAERAIVAHERVLARPRATIGDLFQARERIESVLLIAQGWLDRRAERVDLYLDAQAQGLADERASTAWSLALQECLEGLRSAVLECELALSTGPGGRVRA